MVLTAMKTGLRYSELIGLTWSDIDLVNESLCVRQANVYGHIGSPKNNHMRHIHLTSDVVAGLRGLKREGQLVFHLDGQWVRHDKHVVGCTDSVNRPVCRV
jgi:integrase